MKKCYFTIGYIPAYDLIQIIETMNKCAEIGINTVLINQTIIQKPGSVINAQGQPQVEPVMVPFMETTTDNFKKIFGRAWDLKKVQEIPQELSKILNQELTPAA